LEQPPHNTILVRPRGRRLAGHRDWQRSDTECRRRRTLEWGFKHQNRSSRRISRKDNQADSRVDSDSCRAR
jgi:hypothetical protein